MEGGGRGVEEGGRVPYADGEEYIVGSEAHLARERGEGRRQIKVGRLRAVLDPCAGEAVRPPSLVDEGARSAGAGAMEWRGRRRSKGR